MRFSLALLAFVAVGANAATIQVSCTPPTKNTDGTSITKPITYTFHWGTSASALSNTVPSATCSAVITVPDPAPGTSATYHVGAKAIVDSVASATSNVASVVKSTPKPTPNPPTGLVVVDTVAYRLDAGSWNKVAFTKIGTVELGTACQSAYSVTVNGTTMHMIEKRTLATPVGSLPYQVWAKCEPA